MQTDVFKEIKSRLDFKTVASTYGIEIKRGNMVNCPFHSDNHPSAKMYEESLYCFVCNRSWDAVGLVCGLYNLKPLEAARKLSDDFNLSLFSDTLSPGERKRIREASRRREKDNKLYAAFEKWEKTAYDTLCAYRHQLAADIESYAPRSPEDEPHPYFVTACHDLSYIEYLLSFMLDASFTEMVEFYKESGGVVNEYHNKIREN